MKHQMRDSTEEGKNSMLRWYEWYFSILDSSFCTTDPPSETPWRATGIFWKEGIEPTLWYICQEKQRYVS